MEKKLEENLNNYINQNQNTSENVLQHMRSSKVNISITFNKIGQIYKQEKENKKKTQRIFDLLDTIFNNIQQDQTKVFTSTIIFEEIKTYIFQKYFGDIGIDENIKTDLLKWYEIFFGDPKYEELVQTLTDIKVIPGDFENYLKNKLEEFEELKNEFENTKRPELKKKMKDLSNKISNHSRLQEFLDSSNAQHVNLYFNMTSYVEKFDQENKELTKEELLEEVNKYKNSLKIEIENMRKKLVNNL